MYHFMFCVSRYFSRLNPDPGVFLSLCCLAQSQSPLKQKNFSDTVFAKVFHVLRKVAVTQCQNQFHWKKSCCSKQ